MSLPDDCHPHAPRPSDQRIEVAARAICDALAGDRFGRPSPDAQRVVYLRAACSGFRRYGHEEATAPDDYRWAVKLMIEVGLLRCVPVEPSKPLKDELFDWSLMERAGGSSKTTNAPELKLVSTPQLWIRWRGAGRVIGLGFYRIRCDRSDRSVWLDGVKIAGELDEEVFDYLVVLVETYPDPIRWEDIKTKAPSLGENQGRLSTKVDAIGISFSGRIKVERKRSRGHSLKILDG